MERVVKPTQLRHCIEELLKLSTMTLATVGSSGAVHAADVYFACDENSTLLFFSDASSQHSRDMHEKPQAALTIHTDRDGYEQILGLQMRGTVREITSESAWQQAWGIYVKKFPFARDLEEVIKVNQFYGFSPSWIRLVDNSQGFGFKQEWQEIISEQDGKEFRYWGLLAGSRPEPGSKND